MAEEPKSVGERKEREFRDFAERLRASKDPVEAQRLGDQLGRMVFGGLRRSTEPKRPF